MKRREFAGAAASLAAASLMGCRVRPQSGTASVSSVAGGIADQARLLHERALVIDGNLSSPIPYDIRNPASSGRPIPPVFADLIRRSGLAAIKLSVGGYDASFDDTVAEIAAIQRLIESHGDLLLQVRSVDDIERAKRTKRLGIILSFESVAALETKTPRISLFRALGVRVMQLSYNTISPFGAGVLSPPTASLTELGRAAVASMNKVGVAIDLSHANAATTAAAIALSKKPVLITHGGCAAIHAHPRNKTDEQLRSLAENGGVFGIYDLFYLAPSPRQPAIDDYMRHLTHAIDVCGEDHVGIGSDTSFGSVAVSPESRAAFDRVLEGRRAAGTAAPEEDRMPYTEGLNRADRSLVIADELLRRGQAPRVVEKVLGANFMRVFREAW